MCLRWLAGSEVVQVEAKMANLVHRDLQVEDWGQATFTFANGIVATLEAIRPTLSQRIIYPPECYSSLAFV